MKYLGRSLVILFLCVQLQAQESYIQVPDHCIKKQLTPCLVKAVANSRFDWFGQTLTLNKHALVQAQVITGVISYELLEGLMTISSNKNYKVFGYDATLNAMYYVKVAGDQVNVFDDQSLDLKIFVKERSSIPKSQSYVLQSSVLLNRKLLVDYLSEYYQSKEAFKQNLKSLSQKYKVRLNLDTVKQAQILQLAQSRKMASLESQEIQRMEDERQAEINRKRSRQLFFMRTFKQ